MLRSIPSSPYSHLLLVFISAIMLQHAILSCADSTACGPSDESVIQDPGQKKKKKSVVEESCFALDQFNFKALIGEQKCP